MHRVHAAANETRHAGGFVLVAAAFFGFTVCVNLTLFVAEAEVDHKGHGTLSRFGNGTDSGLRILPAASVDALLHSGTDGVVGTAALQTAELPLAVSPQHRVAGRCRVHQAACVVVRHTDFGYTL